MIRRCKKINVNIWSQDCRLMMSFIFLFFSLKVAYSFEFDPRALAGIDPSELDNVDLSAFSGESGQLTGEYSLEVTVNDQRVISGQKASFYLDHEENRVCFTSDFIEQLPIRDRYYRTLKRDVIHEMNGKACLGLENLDEAIAVDYYRENQHLNIQMPQKFLHDIDEYWVAPRNRDDGISGLVLDYSLLWNYNNYKYGGQRESSTTISSYGSVGVNIGRFRIRSNYQYSRFNNGYSQFDWTQTYIFTDIARLNAKLYAGELYSRNNLFDSVRFKGISLYTDEEMMPAYLRGYAPQIIGTASTNAIVNIKQNGAIIKTVQVPPGPFVISDLPSYVSGTVEVEVDEDGVIRSYQVDVASVPFLTRKGSMRYSINIGRLEPLYRVDRVDTGLISADASYGLTSNISLIGGVQYTTNGEYRAFNLGLGINMMQFGALSIDITQSSSRMNRSDEWQKGYRYSFNYAKLFTTSTSLNITGFKNSNIHFRTLQNYIDMKSNSAHLSLEKERISISLMQYIKPWDLSISASMVRGRYWNREKLTNYNISFNKTIRQGLLSGSSINLSFAKNRTEYGMKEESVSLYMTIPLDGSKDERIQYNSRYSRGQKMWDNQLTYRSNAAFGGNYSIATRILHHHDYSRNTEYSLNGSYDRNTRYGRLMTSASYAEDKHSVTAGFDGSITVTQHGIATHSKVMDDDARLIIDAGASGVTIKGTHNKTNIFGLAGLGIPSYQQMTYRVDNDDIPENVELLDSVVKTAASDGAIVYHSLGVVKGEKAVTSIQLVDGAYPPFGAVVYRHDGVKNEVAIVAEQGLTYLSGIDRHAKFTVEWGAQLCQLKITSLEPSALQNLTCYFNEEL